MANVHAYMDIPQTWYYRTYYENEVCSVDWTQVHVYKATARNIIMYNRLSTNDNRGIIWL